MRGRIWRVWRGGEGVRGWRGCPLMASLRMMMMGGGKVLGGGFWLFDGVGWMGLLGDRGLGLDLLLT